MESTSHHLDTPGLPIPEDQLAAQLDRARIIEEFGLQRGTLRLVYVEHCDSPPRVSLIGHAIINAAPELWRAQGAAVITLHTIPLPPGETSHGPSAGPRHRT